MADIPFLYGYVLGLSLALLIGPVFFTLLKASLQHGIKSGLAVAFGIFFSDIICVLLCTLGTAKYLEDENNQAYLAAAGSAILFAIGLKYVIKPKVDMGTDVKLASLDYAGYFTKGFLINFVNPSVFAIWIGLVGVGTSTYDGTIDLVVFLSGILVSILSTDSLKTILAHRIKRFVQPKIMLNLFRLIGICLILFGIRLVVFAIRHW